MIGFSFAGGRSLATLVIAVIASSAMASAKPATIDHSPFDRLLGRSVRDGRIDYVSFRNQPVFESYLALLATAQPQKLSTNDRLAFWINAYNALTIKNVLANPGMRRPTDVAGFFDKTKFKVAGQSLTLNDIENRIIRPQFKEPLIHFGLVCAAVNCPPILPRAYSGKTVRRELAANAVSYLASIYNRYDRSAKSLRLSKIFEWYKADFGGDAGVRKFVRKYGTDQMKKEVTATTPITYLEYDWTLNTR